MYSVYCTRVFIESTPMADIIIIITTVMTIIMIMVDVVIIFIVMAYFRSFFWSPYRLYVLLSDHLVSTLSFSSFLLFNLCNNRCEHFFLPFPFLYSAHFVSPISCGPGELSPRVSLYLCARKNGSLWPI